MGAGAWRARTCSPRLGDRAAGTGTAPRAAPPPVDKKPMPGIVHLSFTSPPPHTQRVSDVLKDPSLLAPPLLASTPGADAGEALLARLRCDIVRCARADRSYSPYSDMAKTLAGERDAGVESGGGPGISTRPAAWRMTGLSWFCCKLA